MALSEAEKQILLNIGEDAKKAREASIETATLVGEHTKQLTELFTQGRIHADAISVLKTQHNLCRRNSDPGNIAERKGNRLAFVSILVSGLIGSLGLFISVLVAVKQFIK